MGEQITSINDIYIRWEIKRDNYSFGEFTIYFILLIYGVLSFILYFSSQLQILFIFFFPLVRLSADWKDSLPMTGQIVDFLQDSKVSLFSGSSLVAFGIAFLVTLIQFAFWVFLFLIA